jgi:DNA-binding PadR family transcriptional regulator
MEYRLLLLGLLMSAEMHGYQLHETIEAHLGHGVQLKKPTLYKLLNTLHEEGWLSASEEPGERRQTRRVYTITETGKAEFIALLKQHLADYHPTDFTDHVAIAYMDYLSVAEAIPLLEQRRKKLAATLEQTQALPKHAGSLHLFIDHQRHHIQSEIAWLDSVIKQYQSKDDEHE